MAVINQVYQVINSANKQAWGADALQITDTQGLIAFGNFLRNDATADSMEIWMGKISNIISKTIIRGNRAVEEDDLNLEVDEFTWGGILRVLRVVPIDVEHNTEYDLGDQAFDPFKIKTPKVIQKLYSKYGTFEGMVTITDKQLFTAFDSESALMAFYDAVYQQLVNIMAVAKKTYDRLALASFIAEKFKLQETQPEKLHTFDIGKAYRDDTGNSLVRAEALEGLDGEFLRYCAKKIPQIKKQMGAYTAAFNATQAPDLIPQQTKGDYMKFYILDNIESGFNAYLYSDTYHNEMVKIDTYKTVPYWQGVGNNKPFSAANTSKISVYAPSDGTEVTKDGIIAVMMDKDAVTTCYKEEKAESVRVPTKGINHLKYVTYMYAVDTLANGIVFYVGEDE